MPLFKIGIIAAALVSAAGIFYLKSRFAKALITSLSTLILLFLLNWYNWMTEQFIYLKQFINVPSGANKDAIIQHFRTIHNRQLEFSSNTDFIFWTLVFFALFVPFAGLFGRSLKTRLK